MTDLSKLYRRRFEEASLPGKARIWKVLCTHYFQNYVADDSTVVDLACGYGEFINAIKAGRKIGIDLNPDAADFVNADVNFIMAPADATGLPDGSVDLVFTSNFLEHLPDKHALDLVFAEIMRIVKPMGRAIIMGPNLRYVGQAYWDFYDHHVGLTHASLVEGLSLAGFELEKVIPRFLPYTTKSKLPQHPFFVAAYLKVPLVWSLLGKQFLAIARRP